MKKNLSIKNIKIIGRKFRSFENLILKKSIFNNFTLANSRNKLAFLAQLVVNQKKFCYVANIRSQCYLTWRTGSVYSFFKLTRLTLRENFSFGLVKGVRKSSW